MARPPAIDGFMQMVVSAPTRPPSTYVDIVVGGVSGSDDALSVLNYALAGHSVVQPFGCGHGGVVGVAGVDAVDDEAEPCSGVRLWRGYVQTILNWCQLFGGGGRSPELRHRRRQPVEVLLVRRHADLAQRGAVLGPGE